MTHTGPCTGQGRAAGGPQRPARLRDWRQEPPTQGIGPGKGGPGWSLAGSFLPSSGCLCLENKMSPPKLFLSGSGQGSREPGGGGLRPAARTCHVSSPCTSSLEFTHAQARCPPSPKGLCVLFRVQGLPTRQGVTANFSPPSRPWCLSPGGGQYLAWQDAALLLLESSGQGRGE